MTEQQLLFEDDVPTAAGRRVFNNELVEESLYALAEAHRFGSVEDWRRFIVGELPQNSAEVRVRNAGYISGRFAPGGAMAHALAQFARSFAGTSALRQVAYYHFCLAERLLGDLVVSVFRPNLEAGTVQTGEVDAFLRQAHPSVVKSLTRFRNTCVRTLRAFGVVASASKAEPIVFTAQTPELAAFVYVLHHATHSPTMMHIASFCESWEAKAMLWPASTVEAMLREAHRLGFVAKLSEIDGIRQFTTHLCLEEVVHQLP